MMGRRNKQHRHMEDTSKMRRNPSLKNKYLDIVDDEPESGDDIFEINIESFITVIQSNLKYRPLYYFGGSDHTK